MFRNLHTGTKLLILCSVFIIPIVVATYGLVSEKQIAIDFARKELVGTRYLATLRGIYAAILTVPLSDARDVQPKTELDQLLKTLATAEADAGGILHTAELERTLAATLRQLWSSKAEGGIVDAFLVGALTAARKLASRIGDDSNLALDPDLDSYYLQSVVVSEIPTLLGQLCEMQASFGMAAAAVVLSNEHELQLLIQESSLQSTVSRVKNSLAAAYRGNTDGSLKQAVDADVGTMVSSISSYLSSMSASIVDGDAKRLDPASLGLTYASTVENALKAWATTQADLNRLLQLRIESLLGKLRGSLILTGALVAISILIAALTHGNIVRPLKRLEGVAQTVSESKNYDLRVDDGSKDEIGRLAVAFNDMLFELAAARERERFEKSELERITRLTTMGEMTASIAHEVNQPLAAIVANGNAGLRWLSHATPDLDEARMALRRIVNDGHRAGQVIATIRSMSRKGSQEKARLDINDLIREVMALAQGEIQLHKLSVRADLTPGLPQVLADRVQLQQVFLNLIMNAAEAMDSVTDRARLLRVSSEMHDPASVLISVEDSGTGIPNPDRIFEAFFTTKSHGMGMGLAICRSIVEAHGGRLSASTGHPYGSTFRVVLLIAKAGDE